MVRRKKSKTLFALLVAGAVIFVFTVGSFVETAFADDSAASVSLQKQKKRPARVVKAPAKKPPRTPHPYPYGKIIAKPPAKHKVLTVRGKNYYYFDGVFFWPGKTGYAVIAGPVGARIALLPSGYKNVVINNVPHYYYYGTFYRYDPVEKIYIVIEPPVGAEIDELPDGFETLLLNGATYYYYHGTYYVYDEVLGVYRVVRAPVGIVLTALPYGYEEVLMDGSPHFLFRGVYYRPVVRGTVTVYRVVK